jgi:hypothetical protein
MRHVEELAIALRTLVNIYKDDKRDCADIDQPECIKDAMKALNHYNVAIGKEKEYHV